MNLDLANRLREFSKENHIDVPLIVGGYVRDHIFNLDNKILDVDLTTNSSDVTRLAIGFALENDFYYKVFHDLHTTIYIDRHANLDFSSNFKSSMAIEYFKDTKFSDPKYHEVFSRDFTINTLHKSMFDDKVIDPLDMGLKDCDNKIIRTISTPEICFSDDPRRAYRSVTIAAKLGLDIDGVIFDYIKKNHQMFSPASEGPISEVYVTSNIDKVIGINDDLLLSLLLETRLLPFVPLIGKFKDLIIKKNMVSIYLDLVK